MEFLEQEHISPALLDGVRAYRAQLELYAKAIDKRFAPRRVTYKGIYALELGELIEV